MDGRGLLRKLLSLVNTRPGPARKCCRCNTMTEMPGIGAAYVNGHTIDELILCNGCLELRSSYDSGGAFWDEGWSDYPEAGK